MAAVFEAWAQNFGNQDKKWSTKKNESYSSVSQSALVEAKQQQSQFIGQRKVDGLKHSAFRTR